MYLGMGSSTYNSQPYSQISFQSEATELPCREKSMGWDKVTLRDTKAIISVASESRARAKLGGNFKKADFNSSKPKGRKRKHICAPSYCCAVAQLCLFGTPWAVAHQAPLSMGFPRQEYWSGLVFAPPKDLLNPAIEPVSPSAPALAGRSFATSAILEDELEDCN